MSRYYFALNSPPISFTKSDLYSKNENMIQISPYIKAISDSFFLSNQFRKNLYLYYCTSFNNKSIIITFDGSSLRYLGPSFFSAAHLLIRVMNHLVNSSSKQGKLTPGLNVHNEESSWIFEKRYKDKWIQINYSNIQEKQLSEFSMPFPILFLFGFDKINSENIEYKISWGPLEIDEQVILTNHYIESVK
ncbi:MAG: hypothetical protein H7641_11855 [Candidatus Heimdallarchaeota archaeon]|nr:hypothetical protein [Candidatus Heimdallarchaeota archaeon]MCK4878255.1 hypothetical protein [Candidatus Heimdallarchaeota archaeon]